MHIRRFDLLGLLAVLSLLSVPASARATRHGPPQHPPALQQAPQTTPPATPATPAPEPQPQASGAEPQGPTVPSYAGPNRVLEAPVSALLPGNTRLGPTVKNPVAGDPEAIQRGMSYFTMFNCSGCHAPNAGGGMGPSLSNKFFIYGGEPQNIYLSIYHGRPNGMPSWGAMLPENIIWDLVAYIHSISSEPSPSWGQTFSHDSFNIEQVPGEFAKSATPWSQTERFGFGQKPNEKR